MCDDIRIQFSQKGITLEDYNYNISDYKTQTSEDSNHTNESNTQEATGSLWDEKSVTVEAWGHGNNSSLSGIVYNNYDIDTLVESANMEKSEIISELINAIANENDINNIDTIRVGDEISLVNPYELFEIEYDESLDEQEESISQTTVPTEPIPEAAPEVTTPDATEPIAEAAPEVTTPDTTEPIETVPQGENNVNTETDWYSQLSAAEQALENANCKLTNAMKEKRTIKESLNGIQQGTFINMHVAYEPTNKTPKQVLTEELQKQQEIIDSANKEIEEAERTIEEAKKEIERQRREDIVQSAAQYNNYTYKEMKKAIGNKYLPNKAWCAMFVYYSLTLNKDLEIAPWYKNMVNDLKNKGQIPEGCPYIYNEAKKAGALIDNTSEVQPGDLIIQDWGYDGKGDKDHIGIVSSVETNADGTYSVIAIEGNTNNEVHYVKYILDQNGKITDRYITDENGTKTGSVVKWSRSNSTAYFCSMATG